MAERASKVPEASERRSVPTETSRHSLFSLQREVDRLFDDFSRGFSLFPFGARSVEAGPLFAGGARGQGLSPSIDVAETPKGFEITAELPGMSEEDIDVSLSNGVLVLKGEKREETKEEDKEKGYYLSERRYGTFQRAFHLPDGVDENKIEANFDKGVLRITLPKSPAAMKQEKKIAIKSK